MIYCLHCGVLLDDLETVVRKKTAKGADSQPIISVPKPQSTAFVLLKGLTATAVFLTSIFAVIVALVIYGSWGSSSEERTPPKNTASNKVENTPTSSEPISKPSRSPETKNTIDRNLEGDGTETAFAANPGGGRVNLRRDCDSKDCSTDPTTLYTEVEPGTPLVMRNQIAKSRGYMWQSVRYQGKVLWISSTKLNYGSNPPPSGRPPANIQPPVIKEYDKQGRQLRAICNNGEPSYWQHDKFATCGMNGGVSRWNPQHPGN